MWLSDKKEKGKKRVSKRKRKLFKRNVLYNGAAIVWKETNEQMIKGYDMLNVANTLDLYCIQETYDSCTIF